MFKKITFQDDTTEDKILEFLDKLPHGEGNIDIDVADVKTILDMKGVVDVKTVHSTSIVDLVRIFDSLARELEDRNVQGILALYEISSSIKLDQLEVVVDKINAIANEDADIIFGTFIQNNFAENEIIVTFLINIYSDLSKKI